MLHVSLEMAGAEESGDMDGKLTNVVFGVQMRVHLERMMILRSGIRKTRSRRRKCRKCFQ